MSAPIEKWDFFELVLAHQFPGNPFIDVTLTAVFSLHGREVKATGFYDGKDVFKIRFMPDQEGEWRYVTRSNVTALDGQHVVVATSTASGKTLCFHVPVLEALARDPLARALYIYPTKALAQDQLGKWREFAGGAGPGIIHPEAATYDGDTPQGARSRVRKTARVLLTNPDMLHAGILPNHPLWAEFFRHLKVVVIDEAHSYRGVFGSQVACVLRRLRRVCALYQPERERAAAASSPPSPGGGPRFMATSATIAN